MINSAILIGEPLLFKNRILIYPPKVRDVVSNPMYGAYSSILTTTAEDIQDMLKKEGRELDNYPTPLEFLLANCYEDKNFEKLSLEAFKFFCHTDVIFSYEQKAILFKDGESVYGAVTEEEYFNFQNKVREAMGEKAVKPPEPFNPNEDPRIRRIKEKARERDRIKAKQASKGGISLSTCLTAICCMGIGITPLNIGEMSYASVGEIMKMMQDKEKYDIDIRSLLAGASSKKVKPKYWIRNTND